MSAAALRAPARWTDAARAEAAVLLRSRQLPLTLLVVVLVTAGPFFGGAWDGPFSEIRSLLALMFFFPFLHWRGRAGRGSLDVAMPVGAMAYDLVRVACGTLAAALTLALATGVHAWTMERMFDAAVRGGYPASYPFSLMLMGMAYYLFGSAIMLRASRPGWMLLAAYLAGTVAMFATGRGPERYGTHTRYAADGSQAVTYTTSLTLAMALAWLGCAAAAAVLSAWLGRRGATPLLSRFRRPRTAAVDARPSRPVRANRAALRGPRGPAAGRIVFVRQLAGQAPRMAWLLAGALVLGGWMAAREVGSGPTFLVSDFPFTVFWFAAFFWPLLVWADERARNDWDEAMPVDAFTRRLAQAAAGLAWLQMAVHLVLIGCIGGAAVAGNVMSMRDVPAQVWPGLPLCALALYALGSLPALLSRRPVGWSIIAFLLTAQGLILASVLFRSGPGVETSPLSPSRVFAPVGFSTNGGGWSGIAALVWIPLLAALAVAALRKRVRLDRHGRFAG